jgi:hypothetical protein
MNHEHPPEMQELQPDEQTRVGFFRRIARQVIAKLTPPMPYDPTQYATELSELSHLEAENSLDHEEDQAMQGAAVIELPKLPAIIELDSEPAAAEVPVDPHKQTPEQIDANKIDLTAQAHALISISRVNSGGDKEHFYLPLHSPAAMMAARVVEAIKQLRAIGAKQVPSSEVAEHVWQRMTLAERQIFVADEETALLSNASFHIEIPVIRVLRRLTHKLMLTHEPRDDRFTLLKTELSIHYSEQPLSEETAARLGNLRPITPPEQIVDAPTAAQQAVYKDLTRAYMRQAKNRAPIEDQNALDMLDLIMSPHGHWAIKAVAGEQGLFKTYDGAMYAMHTYLRVHFHGYGPAYRSRLISGNRRVRRSRQAGGVRQVGGLIPKDSNWVLGQGMQEFFGDTALPAEES